MSHRYKSTCCCEDNPEVIGTCFTGFGAVPKTPYAPVNTGCGDDNIPGTDFNRFDNWELCGHNNQEEILFKIDRGKWKSVTTAFHSSDICTGDCNCPPHEVGYGGPGETPIYTWYASHTSTKIQDEPGVVKLSDVMEDDQVYTWYHTSDVALRQPPWGDGFTDVGELGGLNKWTLPLNPNPRDLSGRYKDYYPAGTEMPCGCGEWTVGGCTDVLCRKSFFDYCKFDPMLSEPFGSVYATSTPITRGQYQLIGGTATNLRWRTSQYGWLRSGDYFVNDPCLIKYTEHGGNYFWLQDIVERSQFTTTDKYYPHWEASFINGTYSVTQRFSFGQCGGNDGSQAPYFGWPLGRTLIAVFHKEKWWQRYWSSIDENDVCPDDDPSCGSCPRNDDGDCPPNWSSTDLDIYPGHFASCRTPKFIGQSCAGIPVFSHEIMTNTNLIGADPPDTDLGAFAANGAEYIILACAFDWPIPKYLTDIMEADDILPDPNPNLTEEDGEDVAYRIFKKPLRHFNGPSDGATLGRCCVNLEGFDYGTYPDNPGPLRPKGDCGTESRFRVFDIYEDYDPLGATCGCTDPECVSWARGRWDENSPCGPPDEQGADESDEDYRAYLLSSENIGCFYSFGGLLQGEEALECLDCETAELLGITPPEGTWNEACISNIYQFGGTHCFPQTLCIPNISEFQCKVGYIGTWQGAADSGAGCTLTDADGRDFKSCDQLRNEELIGSCCFGPLALDTPVEHCLVTTKGVCDDITDQTVTGRGVIKSEYLPNLVSLIDGICVKENEPNDDYSGPHCVTTLDETVCSETDTGTECDGLGTDDCDGILSLQCRALELLNGPTNWGLGQPFWSPLRNCEPVEAINDGPGPYTASGAPEDTGELNRCTFQCRSERIGYRAPDDDLDGFEDSCFDELEIAVDDKGNEEGDVCGVGYTTEFEYFYGRPGGWSWICNRQLNPDTVSQFPQITRNGSGCALPSGAEDTSGGCNADETYACRTSVGGGPGCFSAGPYPQETVSGPLRSCCCQCVPDTCGTTDPPPDPPPGIPCDDQNQCTCISPCVTCYCGPGGTCVVENIPCEELPNDGQAGDGFPGCPHCGDCNNICDCSNGTQCDCSDCELGGPWEEGCGGLVPCPPPLASICGSGCNDLGQDVDGCQVSDSGVGAIGIESMDFCSYANRSDTCDGSWIQQQGTSLSTGQDDGRLFGFDCAYVNNAFILRVDCPDKDPDRDGPGCKAYCAEYDIAWNTILLDEEDPNSEVSYPIVNGVTFDGDPTSGIQELELYEDCVHNVYQRDITNADEKFAKCFILELEQEDGTYAIADPSNVGLRCPDLGACTDGVGNGCGCSDGSCDLIFGRDMVTEIVVNDPPTDFELKRQRGRLVFSTDPDNNINPIPVKIIWNAKKNPHTNLDGLMDYEWYHVPMKRHKENPSGAFARDDNPDCCKCCGAQLAINGGAGIMCERRKKSVSGEGCGGGRYCDKCLYKRKPSQGEGLPDPECGVNCGEGFYCCPLTGQCIPIGGLPGEGGLLIGCEGCPDICEEGFVCCTAAIPDTDPVEYSTRCVAGDRCDNFGPSDGPGESDPPGAFNMSIPGNSCVPNCQFTINTPITIVANEEV